MAVRLMNAPHAARRRAAFPANFTTTPTTVPASPPSTRSRWQGPVCAFRKGDPDGNRWSTTSRSTSTGRSPRRLAFDLPKSSLAGHAFPHCGRNLDGGANHVAVKARYQEPCIFDADSMRLTPRAAVLRPETFLAIFNSDVFSYFKMKFLSIRRNGNRDMRQIPIVMPTVAQAKRLRELAERAMEAKRCEFANKCRRRRWHPSAGRPKTRWCQSACLPAARRAGALLATPGSCLAVIGTHGELGSRETLCVEASPLRRILTEVKATASPPSTACDPLSSVAANNEECYRRIIMESDVLPATPLESDEDRIKRWIDRDARALFQRLKAHAELHQLFRLAYNTAGPTSAWLSQPSALCPSAFCGPDSGRPTASLRRSRIHPRRPVKGFMN